MATTAETIRDIVIALTPFGMAYLAYKQAKMNKKQDEIGVKVDGMTSKLVEAEKGKSAAEGQLAGMATAKGDAETVIKDAKEAAMTVIKDAKDAAIVVIKDSKAGVQDVKIVEQVKPIDVKNVDNDKEKL